MLSKETNDISKLRSLYKGFLETEKLKWHFHIYIMFCNGSPLTRRYLYFPSMAECVVGVLKLFKGHYKISTAFSVTSYGIVAQLFSFIDIVHTILLIQSTPENDSPTYYEFQNTVESIQQVFKAYTDHLKYKYPHVEFLRCNNHSFFNFVNKEMGDVMVLVHNVSTNTYLPHDKKWLKKQAQDLFLNSKVVRDSSSKN